jgi:hypothetical protein
MCGKGTEGQLGFGKLDAKVYPKEIQMSPVRGAGSVDLNNGITISNIACGATFTAFLTSKSSFKLILNRQRRGVPDRKLQRQAQIGFPNDDPWKQLHSAQTKPFSFLEEEQQLRE